MCMLLTVAALPRYVMQPTPEPAPRRDPWYKIIAPVYAGVFLWVAFYVSLGEGTLSQASLGVCLAALLVAAVASYALFYVPALIGMRTGNPLVTMAASTFGARGAYFVPGLLMTVLQFGWLAISAFFATRFIVTALGQDDQPGRPVFLVVALAWSLGLSLVAARGVFAVAGLSAVASLAPLAMIAMVFAKTAPAAVAYQPVQPGAWIGFVTLMQAVVGFFAPAAVAAADFSSHNRNEGDVRWGGLIGVGLPILLVGGLTLAAVAAAHGMDRSLSAFSYDAAIETATGRLGPAIFLVFAASSITPGCFSAFVALNGVETRFPNISRRSAALGLGLLAAALAATGVAEALIGFLAVLGASFPGICGAMAADYWLSGRRWGGPRAGVGVPGYAAWVAGFVVGVIPFLPVSQSIRQVFQPAAVYSFVTAFAVYYVLAKGDTA